MAQVNKVTILGYLGQNPDVKYTKSGDAVTTISVATTKSWTDQQTREKKQHTEWHRIVFFKRLAEVAGEYLKKGSLVYIEGELRTQKWQDESGQDRYTTEIIARDLQMLGGRDSDSKNDSNDNQLVNNRQQLQQPTQQNINDFDDDIPF